MSAEESTLSKKCKWYDNCTNEGCVLAHSEKRDVMLAQHAESRNQPCKRGESCFIRGCKKSHRNEEKRQLELKRRSKLPCRYGRDCKSGPGVCSYCHDCFPDGKEDSHVIEEMKDLKL